MLNGVNTILITILVYVYFILKYIDTLITNVFHAITGSHLYLLL